jgi:hypothetical protein
MEIDTNAQVLEAHMDMHRPRLHRLGHAIYVATLVGRLGAVLNLVRPGRRNKTGYRTSMISSQARVPTPNSERYAKQLCSHAARMTPHAQWTPPHGMVQFPDQIGTCQVTSEPDHLVLAIQATNPANLASIQQIIGGNIERFASREGLKVQWIRHRNP